jgi:hypothetical protein
LAKNIFCWACAQAGIRARRRAKGSFGVRVVVAVMVPPPSRGLLRKVFEGETLGLDFVWY